MEHLDLKGRKCGSKRWRLHHWRAQYVQEMVERKAHRTGMRVSRVCAWNTSRLAFDGSGRVVRDLTNYSLCTFQTGKRYHADLNAGLNIGARYFVRELFKSLSETTRQALSAKVPEVLKRSTCTLCTLLRVSAVLRTQCHSATELSLQFRRLCRMNGCGGFTMEQHLKIGIAADTSRTLRCYFAWLADERKLVIGHCGEHLPVSSHK